MYLKALLYISFVNVVAGRDFAIGMFRHNDILVAQDIVYKERVPFRETTLKYGKTFTCLLTYFRIVDRLGYGDGPKVQVIRGGLHKMYIAIKVWSYNLPIAVTIQAGCEAPKTTTTAKPDDDKEEDEESDDATHSDAESDENEDATKSAEESKEKEEAETKAEGSEEEAEKEAADEGNAESVSTTEAEGDEGEGEANENESLRRKNLNTV